MKSSIFVPFLVLYIGLAPVAAISATQSVTATMAFDVALSLNKVSDVSFGVVKASTAGTYTINTSGNVTASSGGVFLGGTSAAGNLTISGSSTQTVAISTGSYLADHGVSLSSAICSYNSGTATTCDSGLTGQVAPGAGKTLKIGVTAVSDGTAGTGVTATPSFTVSVIYG
jgi:hypothetical protein